MTSTFDRIDFQSGAIPISDELLAKIKICLIMVPHPDDESLACAGLIQRLIAIGVKIRVILTTDGSKSHPNSKVYPKPRLAAIRRQELIAALKILGIDEEHLRCYESPDSAMPGKGDPGFDALATRLHHELLELKPDIILTPYELDPHRDHRATWQMLMSALEKSNNLRPIIWEYPIWLYENAAPTDVPILHPGELYGLEIGDLLRIKKQAIAAHQSQTTNLISDDPKGFMLSEHMISHFLYEKEFFMQRTKLNPFDTISKEYFEALYQKNEDPWKFATSAYENEKYLASLAALPNKKYANALEIGCSIGIFTAMLARQCDHILAMEISETAIKVAEDRLRGNKSVEFILAGIPGDFPDRKFDLIVMSEVGYYLSLQDLVATRQKIIDSLTDEGTLLLVHWTHFVVDYPLSGDEVHDCFKDRRLQNMFHSSTADYRIDLFQKI